MNAGPGGLIAAVFARAAVAAAFPRAPIGGSDLSATTGDWRTYDGSLAATRHALPEPANP